MSRPRYLRTRQTHCVHTDNWHLYVFPWAKTSHRLNIGVTVKHRRRDTTWRHMTARTMFYKSDRGDGRIMHAELVTHVSTDWGHGRIPYSKRYIRFKICL